MLSHDLWYMMISPGEKIIRTVVVYLGLLVILRLSGKRDLAQLNSFDLIVMLLLSNVVQNAIIGDDNSLSGGLLGAAVLIAVNAAVVRLTNRHPALVRAFEGSETVIVQDGHPLVHVIKRLGLRVADIVVALRRQGANDVTEVKRATLAPGGTIVVALEDDAQNVTRADLAAANTQLVADLRGEVRAALAELEARLRPGPAA